MHRLPKRRLDQHTQASIAHISDRREIILVVDEIDNAVDAKDWQRCRDYFTDEVWGNYTHTLRRTGEGWKCTGMTFVVIYARGNEMARDYLPQQQ